MMRSVAPTITMMMLLMLLLLLFLLLLLLLLLMMMMMMVVNYYHHHSKINSVPMGKINAENHQKRYCKGSLIDNCCCYQNLLLATSNTLKLAVSVYTCSTTLADQYKSFEQPKKRVFCNSRDSNTMMQTQRLIYNLMKMILTTLTMPI